MPVDGGNQLEFKEDNTFTIYSANGITLLTGTYSIEGDTYIEESNTAGCPSPMSYKYTFDGSNLTFQYIGDPADDLCEGRRNDFNNQTYVLSN